MASHSQTPHIVEREPVRIVGVRGSMSLADYTVAQLWRSFMPRRNEVEGRLGTEYYSVAVYDPGHFANFKPHHRFERWAAVAVSAEARVPEGMEDFVLPGGRYAVFDYKGLSTDRSVFQYIFGVWLPASGYHIDDRPHFECLGERYAPNDPNSEEQIFVPIR